MRRVFSILFVYTLANAADIELLDCRPPDLPKGGGYGPRHKTYSPGDIVHYYCDTDSYIGGHYLRICQDTGDWSGDTPVCDAATKFSNVWQSSTLPNGDARNAVDGMRSTCTSTQGGEKEEWVGNFTTPGELIRVMIFLPKGPVSYNVLLLKANGDELSCGIQTSNIDRHDWTFHNCPGPNNRDAYGLKIKSLTSAPLQICEIAAHVLTSPKCVDPKLYVEDGRIRLDRHTATLVCNSGFTPGRERSVECVREGVWNRKVLYCIERLFNDEEDDEEDGSVAASMFDPRQSSI